MEKHPIRLKWAKDAVLGDFLLDIAAMQGHSDSAPRGEYIEYLNEDVPAGGSLAFDLRLHSLKRLYGFIIIIVTKMHFEPDSCSLSSAPATAPPGDTGCDEDGSSRRYHAVVLAGPEWRTATVKRRLGDPETRR